MKYFDFFKSHFNGSEKKKTLLIFLLMLFAMFLETFSLGSLVPLFTLISTPENYSDYSFLAKYSQEQLIIYFTIVIFFIFSIKTIFFTFLTRLQAQFSYSIMSRISSKLFSYYASKEYNLSTDKDSSTSIRNIIREPAFFVGGIMLPLFTITTEIFIIFGIVALLLFYSPVSTIFVIIFILLSMFVLLSYTRPKLEGLGLQVQKFESKRIKQVTYSLSGAKDLVLANLRETFQDFFDKFTISATSNLAKQAFYKQITRVLLEYFSIVAICGLIIILLLYDTQPLEILSIVGIYLIAFFRILPASNKIIINLNTLSFNNASLLLLENELKKTSNYVEHGFESNNMHYLYDWKEVNLSNIEFEYGEDSEKIFEDFSMSIKKRDFVAIIGKSGSGKSTLADLLLGILNPKKGKLTTSSENDELTGFRVPLEKVAYVPQKTFLLDDSILANIALKDYFENSVDMKLLKASIKLSCLEDLIEDLPGGLEHQVGEDGISLSGGQIQRIGLARAIYRNPEFLILDEATSALDDDNEHIIMRNLTSLKESLTLIFISHSKNVLKYFDTKIIIEK